MTPQEQEIEKLQNEITDELRGVFKGNMKIFDWGIPENDDQKSANLIIETMQKAMKDLEKEIKEGKYNLY